MKKNMKSILMWFFLGLLFCSSIILCYQVYQLHILTTLPFSFMTFVILVVDFVVSFFFYQSKKKGVKILFGVLVLFLLILSIIFSVSINHTRDFLLKITNSDYEYQTYYVLVSRSKHYQNIHDLDSKKIAFLDNHFKESRDALRRGVPMKFTTKKFDNVETLFQALQTDDADGVSIEASYLDILKEIDDDSIKNLKTIYQYKVKVHKTKKTSSKSVEDSFILYISGSDSRTSIHDAARSDVNILAVINPNTHKILLVSIPRDYYVQLHGTVGNKDKLTHAGVYGIGMSMDTIEDLLSIDIDYYVKVGFSTVIQSVDLLDGIDIYSDLAFQGSDGCRFVKGTQHVNGTCALAFSRERKAYEAGDRHRGENQEQVLEKMLEKVRQPEYLMKYNDILKALEGSFDTNMSYNDLTMLIKNEVRYPSGYQIESYNLDGMDAKMPTYSMGSTELYVMVPNIDSLVEVQSKINQYLNE